MENYSEGSNNEYLDIEDDGIDGSARLEDLAKGSTQFVKFPRKRILEIAMEALGAAEPPVFSEIDCGDARIKVSIKLALTNLPTAQAERITYLVIEGKPFTNHSCAEESAAVRALKHLEKRCQIKIEDFSTRLLTKIKRYNTQSLLVQGLDTLNSVLVKWNMLFGHFKGLTRKLGQQQFSDNVTGQESAMGRVYGVLRDYLIGIEGTLEEKIEDLTSELECLENDKKEHEEEMSENVQSIENNGNYQQVLLSTKQLLENVLSFYGLDAPEYINFPKPQSVIKTLVHFEFPYIPNFKYGGKLAIAGKGYTALESEEEAAYEALLLIEGYFSTKVIDYNYSTRNDEVKRQNEMMLMVSKTIELSDKVKNMFAEVLYAIKGKQWQYNIDPRSIFSGCNAPGQTEAYHFCANGLAELEKYSNDCIASCEGHFQVIEKMTWELTVAATNLQL